MALAGSRVLAAVAVSGALHAGAAFIDWPRPALGVDGASGTAPLRVTLAGTAPAPRSRAEVPMTASVATPPAPGPTSVALPGESRATIARHAASPPPASDAPTVAEPGDDAAREPLQVAPPVPLSYPVFTLPANDDPRRIGLARLVLVVSSEGRTIDVIVTASTMSEEYVDALVKSFAAMRFEPARVRGLPYPGTYEVVVNFAFESPGRAF